MPAVGDLMQSTTRRWITHYPNGHRLGPGNCLSVIKPALDTAAATPLGRAAPLTEGVRATTQHPLHMPRRGGYGADLHRT